MHSANTRKLQPHTRDNPLQCSMHDSACNAAYLLLQRQCCPCVYTVYLYTMERMCYTCAGLCSGMAWGLGEFMLLAFNFDLPRLRWALLPRSVVAPLQFARLKWRAKWPLALLFERIECTRTLPSTVFASLRGRLLQLLLLQAALLRGLLVLGGKTGARSHTAPVPSPAAHACTCLRTSAAQTMSSPTPSCATTRS